MKEEAKANTYKRMTRADFVARLLLLGFHQGEYIDDYYLGPISLLVSTKQVKIEVKDKKPDSQGRITWSSVNHDFKTGMHCILKRMRENKYE